MRWRGTQCDQTERCQEWGLWEQEVVERDQLEAGFVGQAGPGFPGLAGYGLVQYDSLDSSDHLVDHHPVVV